MCKAIDKDMVINNIRLVNKVVSINISEKKGTFKQNHGLVGDCVMPREWIFTKIIKDGKVKCGDKIEIIES